MGSVFSRIWSGLSSRPKTNHNLQHSIPRITLISVESQVELQATLNRMDDEKPEDTSQDLNSMKRCVKRPDEEQSQQGLNEGECKRQKTSEETNTVKPKINIQVDSALNIKGICDGKDGHGKQFCGKCGGKFETVNRFTRESSAENKTSSWLVNEGPNTFETGCVCNVNIENEGGCMINEDQDLSLPSGSNDTKVVSVDSECENCSSCCGIKTLRHIVGESGDSQEANVLTCETCDNKEGLNEKGLSREEDLTDGGLKTEFSNSTEELNEDSAYNINNLPSSLLVHIFHQLKMPDILHRVSLVCKQWHGLCCDPDLWRSINLRGQLKVDDSILSRLTSFSGNVRSLDLTDNKLTTNEGMYAILKQCTHLRTLNLVRCMHLTDYAFQAIGEFCHQLRSLKVDCCGALTDHSMVKIGSGCSKLERLFLNQCSAITDHGLIHLLKRCNKLKLLAVEQCRDLTDNSLEELGTSCPEMRSLYFMSNAFTTYGINMLSKLSNLEELEMTQISSVSDDNVIRLVRECRQLASLNVSLCTSITDRSVVYIAENSRKIRCLYLVACKITDKALKSLAKCPSLEKLDVGWCTEITDTGAVKMSEGCRELTYLGLMRCDLVTREAIQTLVHDYPGITYSTMWLECERLLERARSAGYCTV